MELSKYLYEHQKEALEQQNCLPKCLINMWCGTGKTRTFTIDLFANNEMMNAVVFPSLGLITQYCNDYILNVEEPFATEFKKYKCLAFCSDNERKLNLKTDRIKYSTKTKTLVSFLKQAPQKHKLILVTYQSFENFITQMIERNESINSLIFDEAHHIVGDNIQTIVFDNEELDSIVDKTRFYTATPVNKNGITMYDRDDPENSDCGPLAYEYLYYQAIEDDICKRFETQISLYTQKPEYQNIYHPIFECIIRACLSGSYDYWNILTYHSYVNQNENMNGPNVSFVKEFASAENQKLVKKLFTKIQDEEFPHTKHTYSLDNVILKGLYSESSDRKKILHDFDRKVTGRIYILASCGILNEGIDTKWANMAVPINPTNSIVKESQRIGRLSRIPEQGMSPAVILIPCMVNAAKYNCIDTAEQRDKMIRDELSECGNFNTAMNVISAFKYQYDPELFEMCLMYPNKYAPQEVKQNLETQGLIVEKSRGDLLDNLSYVCENEDIEIDTNSFEGDGEKEILNEIAALTEKTIEIHTQNHDEPVLYINEDANDEEPLRLFYCEDEDTYAPIVKRNTKQLMKRKSTTPPRKRPRLFNVHTHPDLEVLWKIEEGSIDLNKSFTQGILDVDINRNEKKWMENYNILKALNEIPSRSFVTVNGIKLGSWINTQRVNKNKNKLSQDKIELLENIPGWFWFWDLDEQWMENYNILKSLNETPSHSFVTVNGVKLGSWISNQRHNENKNKLSQDKIELLENIPGWFWAKSTKKKDMSKPEIKPKTKKETNKEKQQRVLSELSNLHKEYKNKTSQNLHTYFEENPTKWEEYHKISQNNEESFPQEEIPRNMMIKYLETLPGKKQKIVADMGCGFAEINQHFNDNESDRFVFHNFDHHSQNNLVTSRDIKNTELDDYSVDIAILSLAMWGSNCEEYLNEVHRILDVGGTLLIAEGYNRWNKELDEHEKPINRLVALLNEHKFTVVKNEERKFMFIECRKI